MAISGRLSETQVPGLLQVLSQGKKSGRLILTRSGDRAVILLREGRLIYAASSAVRETLGNVLVCEKLIDEDTLLEALEIQHRSKDTRRLGTVLLEMEAVELKDLRRVLEGQSIKVLRELVKWNDGFFKFQSLDVSDEGLLDFDLGGFLIEEGLRVDKVLLGLADLEISGNDSAGAERERSVSLRDVANSMSQPVLNAEMTVSLLRYATERVDRAILLLRRERFLQGIAQRGLPAETADRIREVNVPLEQPSMFSAAIEQREVRRGALDENEVHDDFAEAIGGKRPSEAVIIPMVVQNKVVFLLYGDVARGSIEDQTELEVMMFQAGLAMEKALLEKKVEDLEKRLESMPAAEAGADLPASASLISQLLSGKSN